MFKSPSRNQRSKGLKIKHVLQMLLLLGVCFWLIYQVKHSHDKKKEFDEKDGRVSMKTQSDQVIVKFGRKDLPQVRDVSNNYKHEEEEEEEETGVEENRHDEDQGEKNKSLEEEERGIKHEEDEQEEAINHEEEEQEEANLHEREEQEEANLHEREEQEEVQEDEGGKHDDEGQEGEIKDEEIEEEGTGVGDDEVDENEQERTDGEAVREEELIDVEKERGAEDDDSGNEEKEAEEKEGQEEGDQNQDMGGGRNAHEAREENYKADDASSAVSHDAQFTNTETEKLDMENSIDNSTMNNFKPEIKADATETNGDENKSGLKDDEDKQAEGGSSLTNSEYLSLPHVTGKSHSINQSSNNSRELINEIGNKPAEVNMERPGSLQNGPATDLKSNSAQNTTEDGLVTVEKSKEQANETISNCEQADSIGVSPSKTETVDSSTRESLNSSLNTESGMPEYITKTDATPGRNSSTSSISQEIVDSSPNEKSEGDNESDGTDESSDTSFSNISVDESQHDPIDSSDNTLPQEEKDARVDLSTLPDVQTEGINNEDAAAERKM